MKAWEHFRTVTYHRRLVRQGCFRVGLYRQGLLHDISKYSLTEFFVGVNYYQGDRSPNNAEREAQGYSSSWLHHKGRNKHHFEYWIDYSKDPERVLEGMKMPVCYVVEMVMDRIAACKTYQKENYTDKNPWEYYEKGRHLHIMHPQSQALLEKLLRILARDGETVMFAYARRILKIEKRERIRLRLSK